MSTPNSNNLTTLADAALQAADTDEQLKMFENLVRTLVTSRESMKENVSGKRFVTAMAEYVHADILAKQMFRTIQTLRQPTEYCSIAINVLDGIVREMRMIQLDCIAGLNMQQLDAARRCSLAQDKLRLMQEALNVYWNALETYNRQYSEQEDERNAALQWLNTLTTQGDLKPLHMGRIVAGARADKNKDGCKLQ